MKRLVLGVTSPKSTPLIQGQAQYFQRLGYEVFVLGPQGGFLEEFCASEGCTHVPIKIAREISPSGDFVALWQLLAAIRKIKPQVINVGTPKMGLLGSIAGCLLRVQRRVYTCRGLRYEHERGFVRWLLKAAERVACACAHDVICISPSLVDRVVKDGIAPRQKLHLIGHGSSNGVDLHRFKREAIHEVRRNRLVEAMRLGDRFVIGFVGRLADRKGIRELYEAFTSIRKGESRVALVVLGVVEETQLLDKGLVERMEQDPDVHLEGFQHDVPLYMSTFDVFVLPAWWEGFGTVLIQAAAMGIPVITTDVTGCRDAVSPEFNGLMVPPKDSSLLADAISAYLKDPDLRREHGENGRIWAGRFQSEMIWDGIEGIYTRRG